MLKKASQKLNALTKNCILCGPKEKDNNHESLYWFALWGSCMDDHSKIMNKKETEYMKGP